MSFAGTSGSLSSNDLAEVTELLDDIDRFASKNKSKIQYYESKDLLRDIGISTPPAMQWLKTVIGWPGVVVDVLDERLDFQGWVAPGGNDFGLKEVFARNELDAEAPMGHLDSMICGMAFTIAGTGRQGEPDPLVTIESPLTMTARENRRTRRVELGLAVTKRDKQTDQPVALTWYRPRETVYLEARSARWVVVDRDDHKIPRPPVARLVNRPRSGNREGRSEITPGVRYLTDAAVRDLLGAEVLLELFKAPQRWAAGVTRDKFVNEAGDPVPLWQAYAAEILAIGRDDEGNLPEFGQFPSESPEKVWDGLRAKAQLLSGEVGIPASYLGFHTDNPASADAIKAGETRLLKRSERRQVQLGRGWLATAENVLLVRDGVIPDGFGDVSCSWRDAATPTKAAQADAAVKLVEAEILPRDSDVTWDYIGLSMADQMRLRRERGRQRATAVLERARQVSPEALALATRTGVEGDG